MLNIYRDIAERTNGDIYIGVVGPVRTGKSTFVSQFMEKAVLPEIKDKNVRKRALDELPQSADGKTIMTTQPNFVPNEAVRVNFDKTQANIRLIDCVGYLIEGAEGHLEGDKQRLVKTPWDDKPMPFEKAAETGTYKVVSEHSTVAVVVTTDGTIGNIPRSAYVPAEERVVAELTKSGKPFVVVLNSAVPDDDKTIKLAQELQQKYGVSAIALDVLHADKAQLEQVVKCILGEFPVRKTRVDLPKWMRTLDKTSPLIADILEKAKRGAEKVLRMKDCDAFVGEFCENDDYDLPVLVAADMGKGEIKYEITPKPDLFYRILSEFAGMEISDEYGLMSFVTTSSYARTQYEALKSALASAEESGYGVVMPTAKDMRLDEPEIIKQGSKYGVRLKATAPSLHLMKIDVSTEVSPTVGTEQQSRYLLSEFQQDPQRIWDTNMFGKSLSSLVMEGLSEKCEKMPAEIQTKLVKTVGRIVNEGKGGMICLLL